MATNYVNKAITAKAISQINGKPIVDLELRELIDTELTNIGTTVTNALNIASTANVKAENAMNRVDDATEDAIARILELVYSRSQVDTLLNAKTSVHRTSEIENDSGFITNADLVAYATINALEAGYVSKNDIEDFVTQSDLENLDIDAGITVAEKENISLDHEDLMKTGIYAITNASNSPTLQSNGILTVKEFGDKGVYQVWNDIDGINARRFPNFVDNDVTTAVVKEITANDSEVTITPTSGANNVKIYTLESGKKYVLTGHLYGHIVINNPNDVEPIDHMNVELTLNDFVIDSDVEQAIQYTDTKSMIINLVNKNYIRFTGEEVINTNSAVIFSQGNIKVNGLGYLFIDNQGAGNHGIKGDEVSIFGNPYIYINNYDKLTAHDGIHSNRDFLAQGGYIELHNCKDGIGCEGKMLIVNTTIKGYDINEDLLDLEDNSLNAIVYDSQITNDDLPYTNEDIKIFSESDLDNSEKMLEIFGQPKLFYLIEENNELVDGEEIVASEGKYNITTGGAEVRVEGYLGDTQIYSIASGGLKLRFDNAFIDATENNAIYHGGADKSLSIKVNPFSLAIIANRSTELDSNLSYGAVKSSERNIKISGDGALYCISNLSDALDADDDIVIEGDGFRKIYGGLIEGPKKKYGIKCKELHIGADPGDVAENVELGTSYQTILTNSAYAKYKKNTTENGIILVYENSRGLLVAPDNAMVADGNFTDRVGIYHLPSEVLKTVQTFKFPLNIINKLWNTDSISNKQEKLVSGVNIKTVNNESLLGPGNISLASSWDDISGKPTLAAVATSGDYADLTNKPTIPSLTGYATETWVTNKGYLTSHQDISGKQDTLVSGTNIKTINNTSLLGSGNISICEVVEAGALTQISYNKISQYKIVFCYGYKDGLSTPNQFCFYFMPDQLQTNDDEAFLQFYTIAGSSNWEYPIRVKKHNNGNVYWWSTYDYNSNDTFYVTKIVGVK